MGKVLHIFKELVKHCRVDAMIDNLAVMHACNNQGGKGRDLNNAIKALSFTTVDLNILLHMLYVPSQRNPTDAPSRRLSSLDYTLTSEICSEVQLRFGGENVHSCDLMALHSNAMSDRLGVSSPPFHAIPFALFNRGELVRARFDAVFYSDAASVCFPAKCSSRPSLELPPVL